MPKTTVCMMRPEASVNIQVLTGVPRKMPSMALRCSATPCRRAITTAKGSMARVENDSRWIGLNGP